MAYFLRATTPALRCCYANFSKTSKTLSACRVLNFAASRRGFGSNASSEDARVVSFMEEQRLLELSRQKARGPYPNETVDARRKRLIWRSKQRGAVLLRLFFVCFFGAFLFCFRFGFCCFVFCVVFFSLCMCVRV